MHDLVNLILAMIGFIVLCAIVVYLVVMIVWDWLVLHGMVGTAKGAVLLLFVWIVASLVVYIVKHPNAALWN